MAKGISLNRKALSLKTKKTYSLKLKGAKAKKVKWKSNNKKIAIVKKGLVKAKSEGTCMIIAKYKKKKYYCKVTVKKASENIPVPSASPELSQTPDDVIVLSEVHMTVMPDIEQNVLKLEIINDSDRELTAGYYFTLEKSEDREWISVPFAEGSTFSDVAILIAPKKSYTYEIRLSDYFTAPLSKGRYRIGTELYFKEQGQKGIVQTEFLLE